MYDAVMFHNNRDTDSRLGPPEVPWNIAPGPATARDVLTSEAAKHLPDPRNPPAGAQRGLGNLMLSAGEVDEIVAFLKALNDGPLR